MDPGNIPNKPWAKHAVQIKFKHNIKKYPEQTVGVARGAPEIK